MYISRDLLPVPRRSPKHGPVRPLRHYLLQTGVEIPTVQRDHHLEARMGITQAQCAAVRFGDLTAEIEPEAGAAAAAGACLIRSVEGLRKLRQVLAGDTRSEVPYRQQDAIGLDGRPHDRRPGGLAAVAQGVVDQVVQQ